MTRRGFFEVLFGAAVVVGFKTTFGIPIAQPTAGMLMLDEIVATTLRNRTSKLAVNMTRNNALFAKLGRGNA